MLCCSVVLFYIFTYLFTSIQTWHMSYSVSLYNLKAKFCCHTFSIAAFKWHWQKSTLEGLTCSLICTYKYKDILEGIFSQPPCYGQLF